jgi:hypothetical protein
MCCAVATRLILKMNKSISISELPSLLMTFYFVQIGYFAALGVAFLALCSLFNKSDDGGASIAISIVVFLAFSSFFMMLLGFSNPWSGNQNFLGRAVLYWISFLGFIVISVALTKPTSMSFATFVGIVFRYTLYIFSSVLSVVANCSVAGQIFDKQVNDYKYFWVLPLSECLFIAAVAYQYREYWTVQMLVRCIGASFVYTLILVELVFIRWDDTPLSSGRRPIYISLCLVYAALLHRLVSGLLI